VISAVLYIVLTTGQHQIIQEGFPHTLACMVEAQPLVASYLEQHPGTRLHSYVCTPADRLPQELLGVPT
jgi:hypothetical protein